MQTRCLRLFQEAWSVGRRTLTTLAFALAICCPPFFRCCNTGGCVESGNRNFKPALNRTRCFKEDLLYIAPLWPGKPGGVLIWIFKNGLKRETFAHSSPCDLPLGWRWDSYQTQVECSYVLMMIFNLVHHCIMLMIYDLIYIYIYMCVYLCVVLVTIQTSCGLKVDRVHSRWSQGIPGFILEAAQQSPRSSTTLQVFLEKQSQYIYIYIPIYHLAI